MKKPLLSLFLLLTFGLIAKSASAQHTIEFGIRSGINFSNISDESFDASTQTGFLAGVYTRLSFSDSPVSLQPEVLYTRKGFKFDGNSYQIDYIEVPLLARIDFNTAGNMVPHIYFGPYIGFKTKTDVPSRVVYFYNDPPQFCVYNCYPYPPLPATDGFYKGDINSSDWGITVGGGVDFNHINLGIRYNAGLTKISDDENVSARHSVFSIVTGVEF